MSTQSNNQQQNPHQTRKQPPAELLLSYLPVVLAVFILLLALLRLVDTEGKHFIYMLGHAFPVNTERINDELLFYIIVAALLPFLGKIESITWGDKTIVLQKVEELEERLDLTSQAMASAAAHGIAKGPGNLYRELFSSVDIPGYSRQVRHISHTTASDAYKHIAEETALPPEAEELRAASFLPTPDDISSLWQTDPHKGQWGGKNLVAGRELSATVRTIARDTLYSVELVVKSTDKDKPLGDTVIFHLHPSFKQPTVEVPVQDNRASLTLTAFGAFTVGAECKESNGETTKLELDLADLKDAPKDFRMK